MRRPDQITVDRALLLYVLDLVEPHGLLSDVKLQQLCFLCELQMFGKGFRGFHFEFFRFAYGAFSKDLDNDLTSLRRKERVENFTLSGQTREEVLPLLHEGIETAEPNQKMAEILQAVVATYGPQDGSAIMASVESVELSTPAKPEFKIPIRDIVFHTTLLVPHRIEVQAEFTLSADEARPRPRHATGCLAGVRGSQTYHLSSPGGDARPPAGVRRRPQLRWSHRFRPAHHPVERSH